MTNVSTPSASSSESCGIETLVIIKLCCLDPCTPVCFGHFLKLSPEFCMPYSESIGQASSSSWSCVEVVWQLKSGKPLPLKINKTLNQVGVWVLEFFSTGCQQIQSSADTEAAVNDSFTAAISPLTVIRHTTNRKTNAVLPTWGGRTEHI